jgi:hypothetical protein
MAAKVNPRQPDVVFTQPEVAICETVINLVLERGVPEIQIADSFGRILAAWTERHGTAPSRGELRAAALAEVRRAIKLAYQYGLTAAEIAVAIDEGVTEGKGPGL